MDMARKELAAHEIHEALIVEDIREAADELKKTFERTGGAMATSAWRSRRILLTTRMRPTGKPSG